MGAAWKPAAGAWLLGERVVHLRDPLPDTRTLVGLVLSEYSWKLVVSLCRDPEDADWLWTATLESTWLTTAGLHQIADALAEHIFGQPRWVVQRLWREALGQWRDIDADLGRRGVDILTLAPDRATNLIYGVLREQHSSTTEKLRRWLTDLDERPARILAEPVSDEQAADDFFAAMGALRGGLPPMPTPPPGAGVDSELTFS